MSGRVGREPTRRHALSRLARLGAGALGAGVLVSVASALPARGQGVPPPRSRKPRVPAGRDPGGVAVAVIGAGVDYLQPDIAGRLARDGEGELIGFDLIDADPWPLEEPTRNLSVPADAGTTLCRVVLREAMAARLIPVRVPAGPPAAIAQALAFVAQTPARVVLVLAPAGPMTPPLLQALTRMQARTVVVVPAGTLMAPDAAATALGGVLSVAAARTGAAAPSWAATMQRAADLVVPLEASQPEPEMPDHHAAARVAALAARLVAVETAATGPAMKARLLGLAQAQPGGGQRIIADVARHFRAP